MEKKKRDPEIKKIADAAAKIIIDRNHEKASKPNAINRTDHWTIRTLRNDDK